MQRGSRHELYIDFIEFVRTEIQRERSITSRRMLSVVFWCFLLPTFTSIVAVFLVKLRILPVAVRAYLDWLILAFPVVYSIYFLSAEVLKELPMAFRRGGMSNTLLGALKEGKWRDRVADEMRKTVKANATEWRWIIANFRIDLENLQYRARYLTALAGAVFFLIMRGIDSITEVDVSVGGGDFSELIGLALFLILLYLSGNQTYHSLKRYLNCAELVGEAEENQC